MARTLKKEADGLPPTPTNSGTNGDQDRPKRPGRASRPSTADPATRVQRAVKTQNPTKATRPVRAKRSGTAAGEGEDASQPVKRAGTRRVPARTEPTSATVALEDSEFEDTEFEERELADGMEAGEPVPYRWAEYPTASGSPASLLVRIVVGLVIVILALSVLFLGQKVHHQDSLNSLRSSALADAATYAVYVSSYNYQNLDAPKSPYVLAEDNSTPSFAAKLKSAEGPFDAVLKQVDSTSSAQVVGIGVSSVTSSQAKVVIYVQQTTSSTEQKTPTKGPLWLQMTLVRLHGKWVMSDIIADNITGNS